MSPQTNAPRTDLSDVKSVIFSCSGLVMTGEEKAFFTAQKPFGFILFARNVETPEQVRQLIADFRAVVGRPDAPVLVDQEGGRVQRLRSPHWFDAPSFGKIGQLHDLDPTKADRALRLATRLIADDLLGVGINVDCSPCLDLSLEQTSTVIGDRSFAGDPEIVTHYGRIAADEFLKAGITPVIKHMPGHGRGNVDSHLELPRVTAPHNELAGADFVPFAALSSSPWGMTAHIVYEDIDPQWPATQSAVVINKIIRGEIGFDGLLLTDDLNMQALDGPLPQRAERALAAGIDIVLHCSGVLDEMIEVADACHPLSDETIRRIKAAQDSIGAPAGKLDNREELEVELAALLTLIEVK